MPRMTFGVLDYGLIILYFVGVMAAGLSWLRRDRNSEDYFLAGRTLTLPAFVATLVSTWYGGILGVGEYTYQSGLSVWVVFGAPYYLFAAIFAAFLAPRIRQASLYTIPDKIAEAYGQRPAIAAALFTYCLTNPAPYVLMMGTLLQLIFGWPLLPALVVGVVLSTVYVYTGGFRSDVRVNIVQFVLMFSCFAVIIPYAVRSLGGLEFLRANVPPEHLTWNGGNSPQYVIAWFFIALWTMVDPGFHQRCYAARTPQVASRGVFISILCWMLFDFMTCTAGLYARAALPDIEPMMAYPLLAEKLLPVGVKGLFFVGMLATVMSTLVSYMFLCGVTFSRDFVWRLEGGDPDARVNVRTALGLLLTTAIALVLALTVPSVVKLWYNIGTVFIPGLLLPLLSAYWPALRIRPGAVAPLMAASVVTSLLWLIWGQTHAVEGMPSYPLGLEPMYPGLLLSVIGFAMGRGRRREVSA
ncbi:MAG: sodium:solute symporter family protein [Armatimonadetes bacterium]|nr:sodium:solute symporter family protein [Armatimonadota bacterium]